MPDIDLLTSFPSLFSFKTQLQGNSSISPMYQMKKNAHVFYPSSHAAPSLLDRLPNEILLMIFSFAPKEKSNIRMLEYAYLSWVCKHWRYLVLNTPTFWSHLDLNCKNFALLQTMLHRSKNAPLSVIVGGPNFPNYDDMNQQIVAFEKLVFPNMDRLYSLSLKLSYLRYKEIYAPLRRSVPILKHLHLYRATEDVIPWFPSYHQMEDHRFKNIDFDDLFDNACSLESLTFDMPQPLPWSTFEPMISNLKKLTLRTVSWDSAQNRFTHASLLVMLNHCPCLESLEFKTIPDPSNYNDQLICPKPPSVNLPRLSKLSIGASQDVTLLTCLRIPKLQILNLHFDLPYPNLAALADSIINIFDISSIRSAIVFNGKSLLAYPKLVNIESMGTTTSPFNSGESVLAITSGPEGVASALMTPLLNAMSSSLERLIMSPSDTIRNEHSRYQLS